MHVAFSPRIGRRGEKREGQVSDPVAPVAPLQPHIYCVRNCLNLVIVTKYLKHVSCSIIFSLDRRCTRLLKHEWQAMDCPFESEFRSFQELRFVGPGQSDDGSKAGG